MVIFYYAYIANKVQLFIDLRNSRDQYFKTKTSSARTKTTKFRSRDQDRSLEDYKTENCCCL